MFKNAYYGKPYSTRDGRKAIYGGNNGESLLHSLMFQKSDGDAYLALYNADGTYSMSQKAPWLDIVSEWKEPLELFKQLPHLNGDYEIVDDWGYTPSLYHFDTQYVVSWVHCEEGDTLLDYTADTPEEAIILAYNNYKKDVDYHKQHHSKALECLNSNKK